MIYKTFMFVASNFVGISFTIMNLFLIFKDMKNFCYNICPANGFRSFINSCLLDVLFTISSVLSIQCTMIHRDDVSLCFGYQNLKSHNSSYNEPTNPQKYFVFAIFGGGMHFQLKDVGCKRNQAGRIPKACILFFSLWLISQR